MHTADALPNSALDGDLFDADERARLEDLEAIVDRGRQTFYEVGLALAEIRDRKLYRATHKTFEAYCREKWDMARRTAYQYIEAARVKENLCAIAHKMTSKETPGENLCAIAHKMPTKESQVRPLTRLSPELQREIWQKAVESAANGTPTGAAVKHLVDEYYSRETTQSASGEGTSQLDSLQLENQQLRAQLKQRDADWKRRATEVSAELERLRFENQQLKAELRQRDKDWEIRIALERAKIREEVRAELKAEYQGQIDSLTQQLTTMTAKYDSLLARLEAIERGH